MLAACVPAESLPATCDEASVTLTAELRNGEATPDRLDVCRDQHVMLSISSDEAGLLHLHGYDVEAPAVQVQAGGSATFTFDAVRSGQFPIELHPLDSSTPVDVAILTVHER